MPKIVNKEAVKNSILAAFERCVESKPIENVSLRDIATEAGMSHASLLHYFGSRDELILAYVRYTRDYMSDHCRDWFLSHPRSSYSSNLDYMNAFMCYVADGEEGEHRPNATTQTYVLGHYHEEIGIMVSEEFAQWRRIMEQCLTAVYGSEVGAAEAEAMMILISGTFICNYNRAITGQINDNIIGTISRLALS